MEISNGFRQFGMQRRLSPTTKFYPLHIKVVKLRDELKEVTEKSKDFADRLEKLEGKMEKVDMEEVDEEESPEENPES